MGVSFSGHPILPHFLPGGGRGGGDGDGASDVAVSAYPYFVGGNFTRYPFIGVCTYDHVMSDGDDFCFVNPRTKQIGVMAKLWQNLILRHSLEHLT